MQVGSSEILPKSSILCFVAMTGGATAIFHPKMAPEMGVSLIAGMEYGMERWNGKWNGTVNVHSCS